jgi:hypothetical protein
VIGKIMEPRGDRVDRLIYYLYGPGKNEEHTDPHILAGWRHPAELEPPLRPDGTRDFRNLIGLMKQPHAALGKWGMRLPVWHTAMRTAPGDRMLSDDEWAQIAWDVMDRTGLCPPGDEENACRWVAIRHADDHIHIVVMLARQDRQRVRLDYERLRVRDACRAAEERYGLQRTAPGDRSAPTRASRAEQEKAGRRGLTEAPRVTLRRAVITAAAGAGSDQQFFARLKDAGVLVRPRLSVTTPGQVTGYSVALSGDLSRDGTPVWFGGGKLAADLSWPKLRQRWASARPEDDISRLTPAERSAIWDYAALIAGQATQQIRQLSATNPAAADAAAWGAGDVLHSAAAVLGSRVLRQAADSYDRAARTPFARIPPPTRAGTGLRHAARSISAYAYVSGDTTLSPVTLLLRMTSLAEAVAGLRETQQRAHQAASALAAARQLSIAAGTGSAGAEPAPPARSRAAASFPQPPGPLPASPPGTRKPPPSPPAPRPAPRRGR